MTESLAGLGKNLSALGGRVQKILELRAVVLAVNLLALVLVSYSVARGTWRLWRPSETGVPVAVNVPSAADYDLAALQSINLFGAGAGAPAASRPSGEGPIPRTSLNLVLSGVVMLGKGSQALIIPEGGKETAFRIGEAIMPGVTLESVHPDRVILVRNGSREALILKDLTEGLPQGAFARAAASAPPPVPAQGAIVQSTGPNSASVDWNLMKQELQKPDLLRQAHIVPNAGGGFLVREVQPGSLYEKLGLRSTDVIRSINGQAVNNMDDVMRLYQVANNTAQINVEVTRAGRSETLRFDLH
jgi:general secretion pathway protein C